MTVIAVCPAFKVGRAQCWPLTNGGRVGGEGSDIG